MTDSLKSIAPCGVYCGACPSFNKTCFGCSSQNKKQKRTKSKFGCTVRVCCYSIKKLNYCFECNLFPCNKVNKKLIKSHPGNPRYTYRHELPELAKKFKKMKIEDYIQYQQKKWTCPSCGGIVQFYHYKCGQCSYGIGLMVDVDGASKLQNNIIRFTPL